LGAAPEHAAGITQAGTTPGKLAENTFDFRDTVNWIREYPRAEIGVDVAREQNNDDEPGFERPSLPVQRMFEHRQ